MEKMFRLVIIAYAEACREALAWHQIWSENEENEVNHNIWHEKIAERNAYEHLLREYGFTEKQIFRMEFEAVKGEA